ncbi:MAG: YciI family protein [Stackebrandtia sp.]
MKYALLIYGNDDSWNNANAEEREAAFAEHEAFSEMLAARDAVYGGEELALSHTATTVRRKGGGTFVTDGPYAETAEQLGGLYLIQAKDVDEALEFARACPGEVVELRPIVEAPGV